MQSLAMNPTTASLRQLIYKVLPTDADLNDFCQDYFPEVRRQFGAGQSFPNKVTTLLERANAEKILRRLSDSDSSKFDEHKGLLRSIEISQEVTVRKPKKSSEPADAAGADVTGETRPVPQTPTKESLREFIFAVLPQEVDLLEFCQNYLPRVRRKFSDKQEWAAKVAVLLDRANEDDLLRYLQRHDSKGFEQHRHLLKTGVSAGKAKLVGIAAVGGVIWANWDKIREGMGTAREWMAEKFEDRPIMVGSAVVGTVTVLSVAGFSMMWSHPKAPLQGATSLAPQAGWSAPAAPQASAKLDALPAGSSAKLELGAKSGPVNLAASTRAPIAVSWEHAVPIPGIKKLRRIWGASSKDLWAVGDPGVVLHYDGQSWARASGEVTGELPGLFALGTEQWVAGDSGVLHNDGKAWSYESGQGMSGLRALWGSSPNDLWAVGKAGAILHRQGAEWSAMPRVTESSLITAWGSGPADVWAVGLRGTLLHYDGKAWQKMELGMKKHLYAISGSGPKDVWAVGQEGTLLHYDGKAWAPLDRGAVGSATDFSGVWGSQPNDVWAVGGQGCILHFDGTSWSNVADGSVRSTLSDVWGSGPEDVWAVGEGGMILHRGGPVAIASTAHALTPLPALPEVVVASSPANSEPRQK